MNESTNKGFLNITSEIGKLKAVLLHKPGKELERLTPEYLRELLFDDIPWLKKMRQEHAEFAEVLRNRGTEVYYV
ncbi:MAG: arginine deiminase family protein, partial [Bacilli bacterium]